MIKYCFIQTSTWNASTYVIEIFTEVMVILTPDQGPRNLEKAAGPSNFTTNWLRNRHTVSEENYARIIIKRRHVTCLQLTINNQAIPVTNEVVLEQK